MSTKFGHERRNRQEKVWKEPSGCVGGKESPGLWSFVFNHDHQVRQVLNQTVAHRIRRQALMEAFEGEVRRWQFIVSGYKFMFSWGVKGFANANGLSLPKAKPLFDEVRSEAQQKLRIVIQKIRRTGIRMDYERDEAGNLVGVYTLSYHELSEFLQRDKSTQ